MSGKSIHQLISQQHTRTENAKSDLSQVSERSRKKEVEQYYRDIFSKLPRNTQRAYLSDFNEFAMFCTQHSLSGFNSDFSNNEHCVKRYVEVLCESPLAYRTIKRRLSAFRGFIVKKQYVTCCYIKK